MTAIAVVLFLLALGWLADHFHYDPRLPYVRQKEKFMSNYLDWEIAKMHMEDVQKEFHPALTREVPAQSQPNRSGGAFEIIRNLISRLTRQ